MPAYLDSLDKIPENTLKRMQNQAEDVIKAKFASYEEDNKRVSLDDLTCIGAYLLKEKDISSSYIYNQLYLVYEKKASLYAEDVSKEKLKYYAAVGFYDLILLPDGSLSVDTTAYDLKSDYFRKEYNGENFDLTGYESLNDLENNIIIKQIDDYNYETNIIKPSE